MIKKHEIKDLNKSILAMKQLITNQQQIISNKDEIISDNEKSLTAKNHEIENLNARIKQLLSELYGKKSEKIKQPEEPPVFDEPNLTPEEQAEAEAAEAEITVAAYTRKKRSRAGQSINRKLPDNLTRVEQVHDLSEEEKMCSCGECLHYIGDERSEQIEIIPATIQVVVTVRKKYACRACTDGVKIAPTPPVLLPKSIATPGLLAHVIIAKYEDHLPLYRQEAMWKRLDIDLARSTLCNWVLKTAEALAPLIPVLQSELLAQGYIQSDETPVQIMEINKVRLSKTAYMWVIYSGAYPTAGVVYNFAINRGAVNPNMFFKNYTGYLQSDAYAGYNNIKKQAGVTGLCCWAHARRKFVAIMKTAKTAGSAHYAVSIIAKLYKIEKEIPINATFGQIVEIRQTQSKPILESFLTWLQEKKKKAIPKGPLCIAINYLLDRWHEFMVYLEDGRLSIDNNACENIIRPFTLGRKNWLFMGNERGGQAAAILYSLINTCKLNKINTHNYLTFVITEFPKINPENQDELKKLLPQYYSSHIIQDLEIPSS